LRTWPAMRLNGTLKNWNAERGFGVIAALQGGQQIFVHISAFPRERREPAEGDALTFEIELDDKGRRRAAKVQLAEANWTLFADPRWPESKLDTLAGLSRPLDSRPRPGRHSKRQGSNLPWVLVGMLAILAMGWMVLDQYSDILVKKFAKPARASAQADPAQTSPSAPQVTPGKRSSQEKFDRNK
jgi:cold shock CspA family protein